MVMQPACKEGMGALVNVMVYAWEWKRASMQARPPGEPFMEQLAGVRLWMSSYHGVEHGRRIWMMTSTVFMYLKVWAQKWRACLVQKSQRKVATTKGIVK